MVRDTQPKARILELYGAFGRRTGGWLAVADLITLLAQFGIEETAIRSACSRMKGRGLLVSDKRDGTAGYCLSDDAKAILADGDARLFDAADGDPDHGRRWVLCVFSVPEDQRSDRYLIRSRLSWLGFGQAAPGVAIAPGRLAEEARHMLARLGLQRHVTMWEGAFLGFADVRDLVARAWDLAAIREVHERYLDEFRPMLQWWQEHDGPDEKAFRDYLESLSQWRRLPYLDPGLPADATPDDWPATAARQLFNALQARLERPAYDHYRSVAG